MCWSCVCSTILYNMVLNYQYKCSIMPSPQSMFHFTCNICFCCWNSSSCTSCYGVGTAMFHYSWTKFWLLLGYKACSVQIPVAAWHELRSWSSSSCKELLSSSCITIVISTIVTSTLSPEAISSNYSISIIWITFKLYRHFQNMMLLLLYQHHSCWTLCVIPFI